MANIKYFNGTSELTGVHFQGRKQFGQPADYVRVWDGQRWSSNWLPVERKVEYKSFASKHECDARCMNASGRTMQCECACGGKNHGRGFSAEAA
jgi:hypothetical protein